MSEVPVADAGLGSGFSNVVMQVGGALGLASITSISTANAQGYGVFQMAYALAAICVAASLVVVVAGLPTRTARGGVPGQGPGATAAPKNGTPGSPVTRAPLGAPP